MLLLLRRRFSFVTAAAAAAAAGPSGARRLAIGSGRFRLRRRRGAVWSRVARHLVLL